MQSCAWTDGSSAQHAEAFAAAGRTPDAQASCRFAATPHCADRAVVQDGPGPYHPLGFSHERKARASCDPAMLHSPPVQAYDWGTRSQASDPRPQPSPSVSRGGVAGVGGRRAMGGRGQSLPASLYRHSGLLEGIGSGADSTQRSVAPERYSTQVGPNDVARDGRPSAHHWGGLSRFGEANSPRLHDVSLGRPTLLLGTGSAGNGRLSDMWPTVRPTTLLPPSATTSAGPSHGVGATTCDWLGHSPESQPQQEVSALPAHPYARPLPTSTYESEEGMSCWQLPGLGSGGTAGGEPTGAGGSPPADAIDGCTQVWPSTDESFHAAPVVEPPWHARLFDAAPSGAEGHTAATDASERAEDDRLRSPPRVSAGSSLGLACSRPQSRVLRSCSVNELSWRRSGLCENTVAMMPHMEVTMAAPPLPEHVTAYQGSTSLPPAPAFYTELPDERRHGEYTGGRDNAGCAYEESNWIDEHTQTNNEFAEIADLDHAPRKSYRHHDDENGTDRSDEVLAASTQPQLPTPSTSCTSSAHLHATRRITDAYTTEEEEDDEDTVLVPDPFHAMCDGNTLAVSHEAYSVTAPTAAGGFAQINGVGDAAAGYSTCAMVQGTQGWCTGVEEAQGLEEASHVRTISRRQAMETRLSAHDAEGHCVPVEGSDGGGYLSSVGVADESQNSFDLVAQLAGMHVHASPTHKRLAFDEALDEDDPLTLHDRREEMRVSPATFASSAVNPLSTSDMNAVAATQYDLTNPASPLCLSSTLAPDEQAPLVSGVWAGRRAGRRYALRQEAPDGGATRGWLSQQRRANGVASGLSLLHSRKRCLEEMHNSADDAAADGLDGFFTVLVATERGGGVTSMASTQPEGSAEIDTAARARNGTLKKYRLDPESHSLGVHPDSDKSLPFTATPHTATPRAVLSQRSPNQLFGKPPPLACLAEQSPGRKRGEEEQATANVSYGL